MYFMVVGLDDCRDFLPVFFKNVPDVGRDLLGNLPIGCRTRSRLEHNTRKLPKAIAGRFDVCRCQLHSHSLRWVSGLVERGLNDHRAVLFRFFHDSEKELHNPDRAPAEKQPEGGTGKNKSRVNAFHKTVMLYK
jgi:hypothetical protein